LKAPASIKSVTAPTTIFDGSSLKILIVHARWNAQVVAALVAGSKLKLKQYGVKPENVIVKEVPGSFELPFATKSLLEKGRFDAAISIGVLIKGSTMHFEVLLVFNVSIYLNLFRMGSCALVSIQGSQ
jgi:6,7-dimethyl-8-ribityllumazine synthase